MSSRGEGLLQETGQGEGRFQRLAATEAHFVGAAWRAAVGRYAKAVSGNAPTPVGSRASSRTGHCHTLRNEGKTGRGSAIACASYSLIRGGFLVVLPASVVQYALTGVKAGGACALPSSNS